MVYDSLPKYKDAQKYNYPAWNKSCGVEEFIKHFSLLQSGVGFYRGKRMNSPFGEADFIVNVSGKKAEGKIKVDSDKVVLLDLIRMQEEDYSRNVQNGILTFQLKDK